MLEHSDLESFAGQFFDLNINPLADMMCRLLHTLKTKGVISQDEAVFCVAETIKVIKPLPYSEEVKEQAAATLMRMVNALSANP